MPERSAAVGTAWLPRPTRGALGLLTLAVAIELLGRLLDSRGLTLVAAGVIGTLVAAALVTPRFTGVTVTVAAPSRLTRHGEAGIELRVSAPSRGHRRVGPMLVTDRCAAYAETPVLIPRLRRGDSVATSYPVRPGHRGHWASSAVTVEAVSPLGGFVRRRTVTLPGSTWVHPANARVLPLTTFGASTASDGSRSRPSPTGTEIAGLREWQAGDPAGRVHWRASARRNQLVVMEREERQRVAILVATGRSDGTDAWEHSVARCAATSVAALRSGHSVVLLSDGDEVTARSARHVLDSFAELTAPVQPAASSVARWLRRAGPGAVVLWLSADPPPAEVAAATRAASAVLVRAGAPRNAEVG